MPFPAKTTPDAILETALQMLAENGLEGLSLRNLAARLHIKAPSLYRHFPHRAALEAALAAHGSEELRLQLERVDESTPEAAARVAATRYLQFATQNPALYDLMTHGYGSKWEYSSTGEPKALWKAVLRLMSGVTGRADDTPAAVSLWAFLHGYVSLQRSGAFGESGPRGAFEVGLDALLVGFKAQRATSRDVP